MQTPPSFAPIAFGTNDVQIMIGTFDDFTFDDVIQVLGLSRQCLRLLVRRGEAAFSEVLLKAGQVLEARMPSSSEPEKVFNTLSGSAVRGSGLSFAVYHTQPTGPFPIPRARLSDLYARAKQGGPVQRTQSASEPTLRLVPQQAQAAHAQATPPAPGATSPDFMLPTVTLTPLSPEVLSKALLADLQPLLRQELQAALAQVREQSQALHTLDGRLQALPQLVAAEIRLALAQQERRAVAAAPLAAPAPAAPAPATPSPAMLVALTAGVVVLLGVVLLLAIQVLR
jgi:antitoxin (DNA-binding transcriptional repressor) of toxin-antitoxin stability system